MEGRGYNEKFNFINTIHDSLVFMPTMDDMEEYCSSISSIMCNPCHVLCNEATGPEGLIVKAEVAMGGNMADYDEESNKEGMR